MATMSRCKSAIAQKGLTLLHVALVMCLLGVGAGQAVAAEEQPTTLVAGMTAQAERAYDISWYIDDPASDQFVIDSAAGLRGLSELVNGTAAGDGGEAINAVDFAGKAIYLGASIDLSAAAGADGSIAFTPIGTPEHPFAGTFDGQRGEGHSITNLRIAGVNEYAGLFGYAAEGSVIRNVAISNGSAKLADGTDDETAKTVRIQTTSAYVANVGSLVGMTDGALSNCSSDGIVEVISTAPTSQEHPYIVQRVGGLAGYARGDIDGCSYTGTLDVSVGADALSADSSSDSLRVADSFGGVVGRFGDPDKHGTLENSFNLGDVMVQTSGAGAKDRFGTITHAVSFFVGGVAGYSNGSILDCHNGAYNVDTRVVTGKVFTGAYDESGQLANNRGGDQVGGIVGSLRGESENPDKYNDGDPDDPMLIDNCYNEAQITGLNATGGIVGQTGVYCTVTRCYNGTISDLSDWTRNQIAGKVVTTRWNKPLSGGICGQTRSGVISYCANYAEVRNIQTGYYMAGIAGCIFTSDDYPGVTGEIYACFNSGGIYTVNESKAVEYREAGICGDNEGYVHDCIVMEGSVPYHSDQAIGNMDWGAYANLYVVSPNDLETSQSAAKLNAVAAQSQDWRTYWFINGQGYPVLNAWAEGGSVTLSASNIASVEQIAPAPYVGPSGETIPTLKVTLKNGAVLVQNADFRVIPQPGAYEMSSGLAYTAGIEGIGYYKGTVANCARYDIAAADLGMANVLVKSMKYQFGKVVFPETVQVSIAGATIDPAEYDYVIYGSQTSTGAVTGGTTAFAAYDSRGYVSFDATGSVKKPVSELEGGPSALNAEEREWWLYDRDGRLISDSAGNTYYPSGTVYGAQTSCVNMKSGTPAGYVVKVEPRSGSTSLSGSTIGYYTIEPVNLYQDCTFASATFGTGADAESWAYEADLAMLYREGADGQREYGAQATFTGQTIAPSVVVTHGSYTLVEGKDYRLACGDPNPSEADVVVDQKDANRNVTGAVGAARAAVTILPVNKNNLSNYIIAYFDIVPARFEDCQVSLATEQWAYTGEPVEPDVKVTLNGVQLVAGVDYDIEFSNNMQKGEATYTVTPRANLMGGSTDPVVGHFQIMDGVDLGSYTVEASEAQFNWGYDVHPTLTFSDGEGQAVELVQGHDYEVTYSTKNVTKYSIAPCTATITGKGAYTGTKTVDFHIVPYDATANATNQLRAIVQDLPYGTWGVPASADGSDAIGNVGQNYPVFAVYAYPVVDWQAYDAGDRDACYGSPIPMTAKNDNNNGGLVNRYPARYYTAASFDALGMLKSEGACEVNGNGGNYLDANKVVIATPKKALAPSDDGAVVLDSGIYRAQVHFRTGTGGAKNGATGCLTTDEFMYVKPADVSTVRWAVDGGACTYDGTPKTPIVGTTTGSGDVLAEGEDYSITYADNTEAGIASFTVTGMGEYFYGTYRGDFSIMPAQVEKVANPLNARAAASPVALTYSTAAQTLAASKVVAVSGAAGAVSYAKKSGASGISVASNGTLTAGAGLGAGSYPVTIAVSAAGDDEHEAGSVDVAVTVKVNAASLAGAQVTAPNQTYAARALSPAPTVRLGGTVLRTGTDYTAVYSGNVNAGTATVTVTGKGNYAGTARGTFRILPASIAGGSFAGIAAYTYNGAAFAPAPAFAAGGRTLARGADYDLSYANNVNAGTATVTATGKGNYTGAKSTTFTITKAKQTLAAKAKKAKVRVKLSKVKKKAQVLACNIKASKAQGKLRYKNVSTKKAVRKWKVNAKTGKLTVPKKTKKGTYTVKLRVTAAGNANYNSGYKTVSFKVVVK